MNLLTASESRPTGPTAESATAAILLENVSVMYQVPRERIRSMKEYAIRKIQRRVRHDDFYALRSVSFEIREGEVFGIIGRNGAGKSTLLRIVSRVMKPTKGRVWVRGNVAPLLEIGAGFHNELTGRENIFLNGTLLGFTNQRMRELFDPIADFAGLGDFIDAPLRTYSSGMAARLGFAVATAVRPDILIVDEVLAVGDESFQAKCQARMKEFRENGTTVLLVSHSMRLVGEMCSRAVWLDHGEVCAIGAIAEVIDRYHNNEVNPE
jgi:ABC-type polysaccharide/polyol phosphate transport system ATPase subunit